MPIIVGMRGMKIVELGICNSCNSPNILEIYHDGNDSITLKYVKTDRGWHFMRFSVRDGNYNFQEVDIDVREYDDFLRRLLKVRKFVKSKIQELIKEAK